MSKGERSAFRIVIDPDVHLFIERGIQGGISSIMHRWAEANNKYLQQYDPSKPSSYIMYLDANNLYGRVMSQYQGGFEWVSPALFTADSIQNLTDDAFIGYIFKVDLQYPHHLHDIHNQYPL